MDAFLIVHGKLHAQLTAASAYLADVGGWSGAQAVRVYPTPCRKVGAPRRALAGLARGGPTARQAMAGPGRSLESARLGSVAALTVSTRRHTRPPDLSAQSARVS